MYACLSNYRMSTQIVKLITVTQTSTTLQFPLHYSQVLQFSQYETKSLSANTSNAIICCRRVSILHLSDAIRQLSFLLISLIKLLTCIIVLRREQTEALDLISMILSSSRTFCKLTLLATKHPDGRKLNSD